MLEQLLQPDLVEVVVERVEAAEMDEMWSFVDSKKNQRWLWHAIDHATGKVLAYVLAPHFDIDVSGNQYSTSCRDVQQMLE